MKIRGISAAGLTVALLVIMVAPPSAQGPEVSLPPSQSPQAARSNGAVGAEPVERIDLLVGRSTVLRTERAITRVSLPKPDIADALVTSSNELLVHGKAPGTISLLVWAQGGQIKTYDVSVRRDLSDLEKQVHELFPGESIAVSSNGSDVVLSGVVSSKYVVEKASSLAAGYVEKATNVVNLLRQQEGIASNQILLQVRFAEVSRTAMQELGVSFFTGLNGSHGWVGRTATQQFPAPIFDDSKGLVFSDFLNLFAFNTKEQIGAVVKALQTKGLFQSLAEPNLVTQNGKEASFLAGGEFPIPVVQGSGLNSAVTIMFKEFGVRLKFTPTVVGDDLIQLKVAPEVSALDFSNAVSIQGFRVPALTTRRTETEVELRDGQTFAVAGLIDNSVTQTMNKIPGIGDVPVLGLLFKSRAYQKNATELVVMITPHIVRRDSTGVTSNLPGLVQPFMPQERRIPQPPPAFITPGRPPTGNESQPPAGARDEQSGKEDRGNDEDAPKTQASRARDAKKDEAARARDAKDEALRARDAAKADAARQAQEAARARETAKVEAARARENAKVEAARHEQETRQAARVQKENEERARKQAELDRTRQQEEQKKAEIARREEEVRAKARAKKEAEEAREAAARERVRLEEERRQADERRMVDEKLAKERAALDAEFAKRAAKLDEVRAAQERAQEEERRKADEKRAKERAKRQAATDKALSTDLSRIGPSPQGHDFR
jgi:pilus assembly protein CpaC